MPIRTNPLTHDYGWNEAASRYVDISTGRFVSRAVIGRELDAVITASGQTMRGLSQQLLDGGLSVPEWQIAMEREIRTIHTASGAAARGGWAQMSQADWGFVGSQIKKQYAYLDRFAAQVASGRQKLNGSLLTRAGLYAESGRGTFEEMGRRMARHKGKRQERRILAPVEHCQTRGELLGCQELADLGWQAIGTLPPIGESPCFTHCHSRFEFR
jgi:hypothetical protein